MYDQLQNPGKPSLAHEFHKFPHLIPVMHIIHSLFSTIEEQLLVKRPELYVAVCVSYYIVFNTRWFIISENEIEMERNRFSERE